MLELAIARELYNRYPEAAEGRLAKIRSHVVSRASCALVARDLDLGARLGKAAEAGGIAPDEREKIFKPYYRARNARGVHGAGIGLFVARTFVENHNGSIQIEGALNAGTQVTITLPITGPVASDENADASSPLHRG